MTPGGGAPVVPSAPGFSIAVPGDWIVIDADAAARPGALEQLVDARVGDGELDTAAREEALEVVSRLAAGYGDARLRYAAILVATDDGGPVVASVAVTAAIVGEPAGEPRPGGPEVPEAPANVGELERHRRTVVLPAGPAVRIERLMSYKLTPTLDQEVYAVQYVLPVNETGSTLTLTGLSPAVRRRDDLDRLFREIADTIDLDS